MTLPAPLAAPPMVLALAPLKKLTPPLLFGRAARPAAVIPM